MPLPLMVVPTPPLADEQQEYEPTHAVSRAQARSFSSTGEQPTTFLHLPLPRLSHGDRTVDQTHVQAYTDTNERGARTTRAERAETSADPGT